MKPPLSLLSRRSTTALVVFSIIGSLIGFWVLSADYDCGAQSWHCASFLGIGIVALIAGLGLGLATTGLVVLLGLVVQLASPKAWALEPLPKAPSVAFTLIGLHLIPFAVLNVFGALPIGWSWWLGLFGVFTEQSTDPFSYVQ